MDKQDFVFILTIVLSVISIFCGAFSIGHFYGNHNCEKSLMIKLGERYEANKNGI